MPAASKDEPVRLTEDATGDRVLIFGTDRGVKVELRYAGETLWANQDQMAEMFGVDRTSITKHLKNIYDEGELDKAATCEETSQVRQEGARRVVRSRPIYNLNAVISVGYGKLKTMVEVERLLDAQLKALNRSVLSHGGSVRATQAEHHVKEQYRLFDEKRRTERHADADAHIADLLKQERELPKTRRKKRGQ